MTEKARIHAIKEYLPGLEHFCGHAVIGKVMIGAEGEVFVDFAGNPAGPLLARLTAAAKQKLGRFPTTDLDVLLCFEGGDTSRPIIVDTMADGELSGNADADFPEQAEIVVDGKRVIVDAAEEVVLRCGKASITLNKSGKVLIKGEYVISRASGTQCIQGASVRIN